MKRVLARVRGHDRVKAMLSKVLESGQLHPSLIISGREGIGKRLLASELALALNCLADDPDELPCHRCASCIKADANNHPDIVVVEPTEGRRAVTIAEIRAMIEEMGLKPNEGRRRVFILCEADRLREDAQNTLLKTLEEPPGTAVTILLASRPSVLIETIHSRCQHLRLSPLADNDVRIILEERGTPAEEADDKARFSGGSPGEALSEDARARADEALLLLEALADGRAGRDPMALAKALLETLEKDSKGAQTRMRIGRFGEWLQRGLRDLLVRVVTGEAPHQPMARFAEAPVSQLVGGPSVLQVRRAMEVVERLQFAMERNLNVKLSVEGLVVDLARHLPVKRGR